MVNDKVWKSIPLGKEKLKGKLEAAKGELSEDLSKSNVQREVRNIREVDGKLKADFSVEGLHTEHKEGKHETDMPFHEHYRDWPKIFDSWKELSKYAEVFFSAAHEELKEMVKNK